MVSNLDTRDICPLKDEKISNQSRDEIIDFLVGSSSEDSSEADKHCFEVLRKDVAKTSNKVIKLQKLKIRSKKSTNSTKLIMLRLMILRRGINSFFSATLRKAKEDRELTNKRIKKLCAQENEQDCSFERVRRPKVNLKASDALVAAKTGLSRIKPLIQKIMVISVHVYSKTKTLIEQQTKGLDRSVLQKCPTYKQTVISAIILAACSLFAIVNTASTSLANAKKEGINAKKLSSINWNVSGHMSDNEKNYLQNIMKSGQIKVTNADNSNIKVLSDKSRLINTGYSPSATFILIGSNVFSHNVSKDETILGISQKYKVSISDLISCNSDIDLINLKQGDKVSIPKSAQTKNIDDIRPSKAYSKLPKFMLASRSISGTGRFYPIDGNFSNASSSAMLWPVPSSRTISSKYGPRGGGFHPGVDITAPVGTPIIATRPGVVTSSGWAGGYGKCVLVDHGNGISTRYAHASSLLVSPGQRIQAGQVIAKMGSTGWSTGSHLHYEVLVNGKHTNPLGYL